MREYAVAANTRNASTVAFIADGTEKPVLYVAATYTGTFHDSHTTLITSVTSSFTYLIKSRSPSSISFKVTTQLSLMITTLKHTSH